MRGLGGTVHRVYSHALHGFSATFPQASLQSIRKHPLVAYVEQDQIVHVSQVQSPESSPDWGLDRIDQTDLPLDNLYYFNRTGSGVYAFIVDSGIRSTHSDFTGRVLAGQSFDPLRNINDCNGHGTHVAGLIGGITYGVAKGVSLVPVQVLDCYGTGNLSDILAGIDWWFQPLLFDPQ
jgi:subtilisin family serine protease